MFAPWNNCLDYLFKICLARNSKSSYRKTTLYLKGQADVYVYVYVYVYIYVYVYVYVYVYASSLALYLSSSLAL